MESSAIVLIVCRSGASGGAPTASTGGPRHVRLDRKVRRRARRPRAGRRPCYQCAHAHEKGGAHEKAMYFQDLILALQEFWAKRGCLIVQPYNSEVGAGTYNPATFLRALGPEPWNVAFVEPSRRPSDGRYGENPNRMQQFHQFQVILKPSPLNIQDLYLESLNVLGTHAEDHDVRFLEDDWESPTLGAWGLGWQVWVGGLSINQVPHFH